MSVFATSSQLVLLTRKKNIMATFIPKTIHVFLVFIGLSVLETLFPGQLLTNIFIGSYAFLFLNVGLDALYRKLYLIDPTEGSGCSYERNQHLAKGYLISGTLLFLASLGGLISSGNITHIAWAGIPLSIIWFLLTKYGAYKKIRSKVAD